MIVEPADKTVVWVQMVLFDGRDLDLEYGHAGKVFFERDTVCNEECGGDDGEHWYMWAHRAPPHGWTWEQVLAVAERIVVMAPGEVLL